jgi:hypothetical protein
MFPEKELRGLNPYLHIHASVSDIYIHIPTIGQSLLLKENMWTDPGLYKSPAYSAAEKYVDQSWEYINRSQTQERGNWD